MARRRKPGEPAQAPKPVKAQAGAPAREKAESAAPRRNKRWNHYRGKGKSKSAGQNKPQQQ